MPKERLSKQTLWVEQGEKRPVKKKPGKDGLIISRILVGTVWDFIQVKYSLCWWIEKCRGLTGAAAPETLKEKLVKKKEEIMKVYLL